MNINRILQGDKRSIKAKKNILVSILIKGIDALVYLLIVPVTLDYLNPYEYGIWLTLSSILMWINSFDIGLGNGLRNKLAEAVAHNNRELAKCYVSTTFFMLILIMSAIFFLSCIGFRFIDWYTILNANPTTVNRLNEIVFVSFALFCLNFIFKFVGNVYLALQLPAINNLLVVLGHLLSLVFICILTSLTSGSLFLVAVAYSVAPPIVYLVAYPVTFLLFYHYLSPSFKSFKWSYLNDLLTVGMRFFFIQLAGIVLFALSNILISHLFGPENVTLYNIVYRYFSIVSMAMAILISPMWSAATDAYVKGDMEWIKRSIKTVRRILYVVAIGLIFMTVISKYAYHIWLGDDVEIPFLMSALMALYVFIVVCSLSYSYFLNGLGKLRLQAVNTVAVAILFYPICKYLGGLFGVYGVIIGMCLVNISGAILNMIQLNKIVENKSYGIWRK